MEMAMLSEEEKLMANIALMLNALSSRDCTISFTVSGSIMLRDENAKKICKVTTEDGEWIVT